MKRYYFELLDSDYYNLSAFIPDGSDKRTAVRRAAKWMRANGVQTAKLEVNSMATEDLLELIDIEI